MPLRSSRPARGIRSSRNRQLPTRGELETAIQMLDRFRDIPDLRNILQESALSGVLHYRVNYLLGVLAKLRTHRQQVVAPYYGSFPPESFTILLNN